MPKPVKSVLESGLSEATVKEMKAKVEKGKGANEKPAKQEVVKQEAAKGNGKPVKLEAVKQPTSKEARGLSVKPTRFKTKKGIRTQVYQDVKTNPTDLPAMNVEQAMEIIGWENLDEGRFLFKDIHGTKVRLVNNSTNRPFRWGLANRYKSEFLRGKWFLNGESIIFDWDGKCQSGQHRLAGFILANQELQHGKEKDRWKRYHKKGEIKMECLVVHDVNPSDEVVNSIDQGQKRSLGDVLYRAEIFGSGSSSLGEQLPAMGDKTRQALSNILAGAVRLVWLRSGGKTISDAPHFPVSEAIDFVYDHPKVVEYTFHAYTLEGGSGKGGERITQFPLSIGQAAGLMYLMATSATEPQEWVEAKAEGRANAEMLSFKLEKKAREFWSAFASGAKLEEDDPIFVLRDMLRKMEGGSGMGRDEIVSTVIRAFNCWMDNKKVKTKDLTIKKGTDKNGRPKLAEYPILGGIDMGKEEVEKLTGDDAVNTPEDQREGKMKGKKWAEGDTCWVYDDEGEHWFGTIDEIFVVEGHKDKKQAFITDDETGEQWDVDMALISLKYPG